MECLNSLLNFGCNLEFEVIVVDNNSKDREIEKYPRIYPVVKFLFRDMNDGFGAGCNYGAQFAQGQYLLFANPDTIFNNNVVFALHKIMEQNPKIGVISPIYVAGKDGLSFVCDDFPGFAWEIADAFGIGSIKKFSHKLIETRIGTDVLYRVSWVMGSFLLTRANLFRIVKGFDEDFFLYYEDIDLQYRISKLGYLIYFHPKFAINHSKFCSVRTLGGENIYYYHVTRSNIIYMYKHFNFLQRNLIRLLQVLGTLIKILFLPFMKRYRKKRGQKLFQYTLKLKQYCSSEEKIYRSRILTTDTHDLDKPQVVCDDIFWQS
jgi:GT2 family glycosyltransferase